MEQAQPPTDAEQVQTLRTANAQLRQRVKEQEQIAVMLRTELADLESAIAALMIERDMLELRVGAAHQTITVQEETMQILNTECPHCGARYEFYVQTPPAQTIDNLHAIIEDLTTELKCMVGALERIASGNPGNPKWLTDVEMADIARAALQEEA